MILHGYIDGASRGNPGHSASGIVLKDERGGILYAEGTYLGEGTNNSAEYAALLRCLKRAKKFRCHKMIVHSDSELLVRQFHGEYQVKNPNLRKSLKQIKTLIASLPFPVELRHISSEKNRDADRVANAAIDHRLKFRI